MINITDAIKDVLLTDQASLETLKAGTLNLRAYSTKIKPQIEAICKKKVKVGSMVMALSRIEKSVDNYVPLKPEIKIESLNIKSGLVVVNYEKSSRIISILSKASITRSDKDFFVISESLAEIAIIATAVNMTSIKDLILEKPKSEFNNAVAVTLRFSDKYITIPNVLYGFVSTLASKRVNLLEIVSTLTEVSFIMEEKYMDEAINSFKTFLT